MVKGYEYYHDNMAEIEAVFDEQLKLPGHKSRKGAKQEIKKFFFDTTYNRYKSTGNANELIMGDGADSIMLLAVIVDAVNNSDENALNEVINSLPWGDSNTGDSVSYNCFHFSYWLLSDQNMEKYHDVFLTNLLKRTKLSEKEGLKKIQDWDNLSTLDNLKKANKKAESMGPILSNAEE